MRALPLNTLSRLQQSLYAAQSLRLVNAISVSGNGVRTTSYRLLWYSTTGKPPRRRSIGVANRTDLDITQKKPSSQSHETSLLEELFPHEVIQSRTRLPLLKIERQVPRLAIDANLSDAEEAKLEKKANSPLVKVKKRSVRDHQLTVLALVRASRHLTEYDFRRLVPSGKHIEGWTSKGDILHVICGRDRRTMAANGVYFLLFATPEAAQAYKSHVSRLHRLSGIYGPTALAVPPLLELDTKGVPLNGSLQTYTLMPSTQELHLRIVQQPFSPLIKRLVEQSGYDQLMRGRSSEHEVLISIDGFQPTLYGFRGAIVEDGKARGLLWATSGAHGGFREMWTPSERKHDSKPAEENVEKNMEQDIKGEKTSEDDGRKPRRFIVSFADRNEANRFVMSWHRRDISLLMADLPPYDRAIVNAELVW